MIEFDTATESNGDGTDNITEPWDHTTTAFNNRVMLVAVATDSLDNSVASVTYNGVALSEIAHITISAVRLWVGYLVNPAAGTHAVNIGFAPADVLIARACALTFYNINSTTPIGETTSETSENTAPSEFATDITPQNSEGMIVSFFLGSRCLTGNATSPLTEVINVNGAWSGSAVNKLLGAAYDEHNGSIYTAEWENLTHESSAADQYHVLIELNASTFVPHMQII
jgi:hypothetical protein